MAAAAANDRRDAYLVELNTPAFRNAIYSDAYAAVIAPCVTEQASVRRGTRNMTEDMPFVGARDRVPADFDATRGIWSLGPSSAVVTGREGK